MSKRRRSQQIGRRNPSSSRGGTKPVIQVPQTSQPQRPRIALFCILLAVLTLVVYSSLRKHEFVNYDDGTYIVNNFHIQDGLSWTTVSWAFTQFYAANWHPLTWLVHAVDFKLFGLEAGGYHLTSLLIHILNVLLLFLLLNRVTGSLERSAFVAALFATHPLNVESVAWAAELKNVLCTLFFLLAIGAYGWYARRPSVKSYVAVVLLFLLGLASKPMVITFPFVLLLLDFWPLHRILHWSKPSADFPVAQKPFWSLAVEKLPLLALSVGSAFVTIAGQRLVGANDMVVLNLGARIQNALYSYFVYAWTLFWPSGLAVFYPISADPIPLWKPILAAFFLLVVSGLAWRYRTRLPYLLIGWLWFLGTLVPVIGLMQVGAQSRADRYTYIPLIGAFVIVVWGLADLAEIKRLGAAPRVAAAVAVLAALSVITMRQLSFWDNSYDLWTHALNVTQSNPVAEHNIAMELMRTHRWDEAVIHLERVNEQNPSDAVGLVDLGAALGAQGRDQEAVRKYETAVQRTSDPKILLAAYQNLGYEYRKLGADSKAEESYRQALRINPRQQAALEGLGRLLMSRRIEEFSQSLAVRPTPEGYFKYGQMLQQVGRVEEARAAYEKSLELDPKLQEAREAMDALPAKAGTK